MKKNKPSTLNIKTVTSCSGFFYSIYQENNFSFLYQYKKVNGKKMQGVTVFSRMKEYSLFNNMTLNELNKKRETLKIDRGLKKALDSLYSGG